MARTKNEHSVIQQNPEVYEGIKADIKYFGIHHLAALGRVSHTTLYKYKRGEPVNPRWEDEILAVIEKAKGLKKSQDEVKLRRAQVLIAA